MTPRSHLWICPFKGMHRGGPGFDHRYDYISFLHFSSICINWLRLAVFSSFSFCGFSSSLTYKVIYIFIIYFYFILSICPGVLIAETEFLLPMIIGERRIDALCSFPPPCVCLAVCCPICCYGRLYSTTSQSLSVDPRARGIVGVCIASWQATHCSFVARTP